MHRSVQRWWSLHGGSFREHPSRSEYSAAATFNACVCHATGEASTHLPGARPSESHALFVREDSAL